MKFLYFCISLWLLALPASAAPPRVVAAESVYGDVARQIGGPEAMVTSILANPDQDPHSFEASPSVARAVSAAGIVISNGLGYDSWMTQLLAASPRPGRQTLDVATLAGRHTGENPHVWTDPAAILALARALATAYRIADMSHAADYDRRLEVFEQSLKPVQDRIARLRARLGGKTVTATEPVSGYLFAALGLVSRDQAFQLANMNETEASASEVASIDDDLFHHRVRLLIFNRSARNPAADRIVDEAMRFGIPVIGVAETEPPGIPYQAWMTSQLEALDRVFSHE